MGPKRPVSAIRNRTTVDGTLNESLSNHRQVSFTRSSSARTAAQFRRSNRATARKGPRRDEIERVIATASSSVLPPHPRINGQERPYRPHRDRSATHVIVLPGVSEKTQGAEPSGFPCAC